MPMGAAKTKQIGSMGVCYGGGTVAAGTKYFGGGKLTPDRRRMGRRRSPQVVRPTGDGLPAGGLHVTMEPRHERGLGCGTVPGPGDAVERAVGLSRKRRPWTLGSDPPPSWHPPYTAWDGTAGKVRVQGS